MTKYKFIIINLCQTGKKVSFSNRFSLFLYAKENPGILFPDKQKFFISRQKENCRLPGDLARQADVHTFFFYF